MRAAVVRAFGAPLVIEDRPNPLSPDPGRSPFGWKPGPVSYRHPRGSGDWPVKPTPPFVPGHEGIGTVYATGAGVSGLTAGRRVAVPWLWAIACGTCKHCLTGWETLCLQQQNSGYSVDGCYAEYFLAEAAFAAKVPDGVDSFEAAPLSCAGVTTHKAVKAGKRPPGGPDGDLGCGRARAPGSAVCEDLRRNGGGHRRH